MLFQMYFQGIQFIGPEQTVLLNPSLHLIQGCQLRDTESLSSKLFYFDKATLAEDLNMFGYCRPAHVKIIGNSIEIHDLIGQKRYDLPPCGVGNCLEYVSSYHKLK